MSDNRLFDHPYTQYAVSSTLAIVSGLFAAVGWIQMDRAENIRLAPSITVCSLVMIL